MILIFLFCSYGNFKIMLYQLPNGKVIYLTIEDYLDLTDEDIQAIIASGYGEQPTNPFFGSVINSPSKKTTEEDYYNNDGLDYEPEDDDTDTDGPIDLDSLPDQDLKN